MYLLFNRCVAAPLRFRNYPGHEPPPKLAQAREVLNGSMAIAAEDFKLRAEQPPMYQTIGRKVRDLHPAIAKMRPPTGHPRQPKPFLNPPIGLKMSHIFHMTLMRYF